MSVGVCVREGYVINARARVNVVLCDFKGVINIKSRRGERYCLNMSKYVLIVHLKNGYSATGVLHESDLAIRISN
jgi:hypothetical protein